MDDFKSALSAALAMDKRGQAASSRMAQVITFILSFILLVAVGIPVTQDVIANNNLTGLTATIVGFAPPILAVGSLVQAGRVAMRS